MKIVYYKKLKVSQGADQSATDIHLLCVEVQNVKKHAATLMNVLNDTSWISKLNPIAKKSYKRTAIRTIEKLVELFEKVECSVTKDFGEYMISLTSCDCLRKEVNHSVFPISELWKEKVSNNHGFDFHTESKQKKIAFGEAKYSKSTNPYTEAAGQIISFISEEKDKNDAVHLAHFASKEAIENLLRDDRDFSVAFSMNSADHKKIFSNVLKSDMIKDLSTKCDELFVIGVRA